MERLCVFSTGLSFLSKYPCPKAFTSFPSWGAQAVLSRMICLPQREWRLVCKWDAWTPCQAPLPALGEVVSWAGLLAAHFEAEMLLACRAVCVSQPRAVLLFGAGGIVTHLEAKLLLPRWPRGNFCPKQSSTLFSSRNTQPPPHLEHRIRIAHMYNSSLLVLYPMHIMGIGVGAPLMLSTVFLKQLSSD